jgi:hypothetical protein
MFAVPVARGSGSQFAVVSTANSAPIFYGRRDNGQDASVNYGLLIGHNAGVGLTNGYESVVHFIGDRAGAAGMNQGGSSILIGPFAGANTRQIGGVHIGAYANYSNTTNATNQIGISIGTNAAYYGQQTTNGSSSTIAIGNYAGTTGTGVQPINQICINASNTGMGGPNQSTYIKHIRGETGTLPAGFKQLAYTPGTKEVIRYG